jgi:hypothetical protein
MKEQFIDVNFNETDLKLISVSNRIIERYAAQGYDLSLRQLYYQLVSRNVIPNSTYAYERLGKVVTDARMAGLIDWAMIVDRGRQTQGWKKYSSPGKAMQSMIKTFRLNRWTKQPFYIEVMVEKQALEGVLTPICGHWGISFTANKGYSSASALYSTAKRLAKKAEAGKQVVVLYLGDHDPSGIDMTRDLRDRLSLFARTVIDVKRLALNMSQVERLNLPPNPAKMSDSRAPDYVEKFGTSSWELDAMPPRVMSNVISAAVERRLDRKAWDEDGEREKRAVELLKKAVHNIDREFHGPAKVQTVSDSTVKPEPPPVDLPASEPEAEDDEAHEG